MLLLSPNDCGKSWMRWAGPYEVEEILDQGEYKVWVRGKLKTYHDNFLKKYMNGHTERTGSTFGSDRDDPGLLVR